LVRAMLDIAEDSGRARLWRERGLRRAAEFSWRRTAEITREVYEGARLRF
jgi:glycosyltransferase involved in cell wall biosynthesis